MATLSFAPASSPGSRATLLLVPQILLGTAITIFPETLDPLTAQILVILHVVSALASVMALAVWLLRHARGRVLRPPAAERNRWPARHSIRLVLAGMIALAYASGFAALWGGEGTRAGDLHAALGLCAGLPLAAHLLLDGRGLGALVAWLFVLISPLSIPSVRAMVHPKPTPVAEAAFAPVTRDEALYDSAEWCGRCHQDQLEEWSHSTHARAVSNPNLRAHFERDLIANGPAGADSDLERAGKEGGGSHCIQCHGPTTFYGANPRPILDDSFLETQGLSCGFCHTLRARGPDRYYVSAPETVERYIGQNARSPLLRAVGDLLIRFRPAVHRRDYHVAFLDRSAACAGCHFESYEGWIVSPYAGRSGMTPATPAEVAAGTVPEPATAVVCQDCHMAHTPNDARTVEPGRLVPWGAVRPQRRYHGFPGGNANVSLAFYDDEGVRRDRKLRDGMLVLSVDDARREGGLVRVTTTLKNERVGHTWPTGEGGDVRSPYLQLELLDEDGAVLASTAIPEIRAPGYDQRELPGKSVALMRYRDGADHPAEIDTRIPARQQRAFHLSLSDDKRAARVRVSLHQSFDLTTVLSTESKL